MAIAGLIATAWAFLTTPSRLQTPQPKLEKPAQLQPVVRTSRIIVPLSIELSTLSRELDAAVPREDRGSRNDPIGGTVKDDKIEWHFQRTPIALAASKGAIVANSSISGDVTLSGVVQLIGGSIGGFLGNFNPGRIPFSVSTKELRALATLSSRPALLPEWRIAPNLTLATTLEAASLNAANVGAIDIKAQIEPELKKKVSDLQSQLEQRLRSDPFIENAARKAWSELCRSHLLEIQSSPNAWLEVRPTAITAWQPEIGATAIRIALGVDLEARMQTSETTPDCPFPARLTLQNAAPPQAGDIALSVPASVTFDNIERELLKRKDLIGAAHTAKGITVTPRDIAIYPDGKSLLVSLTADISRGWFSSAHGTVHLRADPVLDAQSQTIAFRNVRLTAESADAINAMGLVATILQSELVKRIEALTYDLKPALADVAVRANDHLAAFRAKPLPGVKFNQLEVQAPVLTDLRIGPEAIEIIAETSANAAVQVISILPGAR